MVFSSISFIYYFLPILLLIYFCMSKKYKNLVLLIASLIFYFYGEPKYIWILILSCLINYIMGLIVSKNRKKIYLILTIVLDLGILFYFKYFNFFIDNINNIFNLNLSGLNIIMPLGISFFTFQTLSYVIDVYKGDVKADKNFLNFATYVCLFPQLVAGPIVRYIDVDNELKERTHSFDLFAQGVSRFIIGLAKKVLIANVLGQLCKELTYMASKTIISYWMSAIGFTLQIYFDFSGYSDMAIGLGLMFGFKFLENFNYPYIANSITDFWRRWHISLSSWLKDYVYIPLGGNRVSKIKWIRNIFIVWFLTGFWHGAAWNFIIWGLYFAVLLIIEKMFLKDFLKKHKIFSHIYTCFLIIISFVIFNASSLNEIIIFLKSMFGLNNLSFSNFETFYYLRSYILFLLISMILSTPIIKLIKSKIKNQTILDTIEIIGNIVILFLVTAYLIDASFNPFLYFRF